MKVILATGVPRLNNQIEQKFISDIEVVGKPLFREALDNTVSRTQADVLLLSDELEGTTPMEELILLLRARHSKTRIVYIGKNMNDEFKAFLYKYMVFDILKEKFLPEELKNAFFYPKQWEDVSKDIKILDEFQKIDDFSSSVSDSKELASISKSEYAKIKPIVTGKSSLYQEYVAFWSVLDQSGKTFNAVNTSIFLASNKDLKILLLDFNIKNPNIHLQFGFQDADRNLGALIEDFEEGRKINHTTLQKYLISHPVYTNLFILPGYILKHPDKEAEYYINILNQILHAAQGLNFSTILIDMESGLTSPLNIHILKLATKTFLHATESPGSLYAIRKTFDPEIGQFVPNLLNKKKVFPVLNRAHEEYYKKFKHALDATVDGNPTVTTFKEDEEIHQTIFEGSPLLKKPTDQYYMTFLKVANIIHPGLFKSIKKPAKENKPNNTNAKFHLFGSKKK